MKKYIFFLLMALLLFNANSKGALLSEFKITPANAQNIITVSETASTNIQCNFTIVRYYAPYGYEYVDWTISLVLKEPGGQETNLSWPVRITSANFNALTPLRSTISGTIPAGKTVGDVYLKYVHYDFDNWGERYELPLTGYSSGAYAIRRPLTFNINNANIFAVVDNSIRRVDNNTGAYITVGSPEWQNTDAMTSLDGFLYIVQAGNVHKVDKTSGSYSVITNNFPNTEGITALDGELYIVENNDLHRMNKDNGSYTVIGTDWSGTEAMTALDGYIYIIQKGHLHKVNKNGSYSLLGGQVWNGTNAMSSLDGYLYIVQNGYLHKVDKNTGTYSILGGQVWNGTLGIASYNGNLYIFQNQRIHKVDKNTGNYSVIGDPYWGGTAAVASL